MVGVIPERMLRNDIFGQHVQKSPLDFEVTAEVLSVEITWMCRELVYTDNDFHINLGLKFSTQTMVFSLDQDSRKCFLNRQWFKSYI